MGGLRNYQTYFSSSHFNETWMKDNFAYTSYYYMNSDEAHPSKRSHMTLLFLIPKDPQVSRCKTTQNYPFWKKDL
jgi:hypothetical protein